MMRRKDPLTESECATLVDAKLTIKYLCRHFNCSKTTVHRARDRILTGELPVYLFKLTVEQTSRDRRRKHFLKSDGPTQRDMGEGALGRDPISACDAHLEDLQRFHGTRMRM